MKNENIVTEPHLEIFGSVEPHEYENCKTIESVEIWDADKIGEYAFAGCTNLREVSIIGELKVIKDYAFLNCSGLRSIVIPDCVRIEKHAFDGVFSPYIPEGSVNLDLSEEEKQLFDIDNGVLKQYKGNDSHVEIPNGVIIIDYKAFYHCESLQSVVIPDSVSMIGGDAFRDCNNLREVVLSNNLEMIKGFAFFNCKKMEIITIPDNVTEIGSCAFPTFTNLIIRGKKGSEAERYAEENDLEFEEI